MLLGRLAANLVDCDALSTTTLKTSEPTQHITAKAQDVFHRAQLHFLGSIDLWPFTYNMHLRVVHMEENPP